MKTILAIIIGYLFGSLNGAYLLGRVNGIDIRDVNSHNPGAANAKLTFGWKGFFFTWIFDMAKTNAAYYLVRFLFPNPSFLCVIAAAASVFGHCYPIFMKFKGGKGFSSYCGLVLAFNPIVFGVYAVIIGILAFTSNSLTFITFFALIVGPLTFLCMGAQPAMTMALLICSFFVGWRHYSLLIKFLHNEEPSIDNKITGIGIIFRKQKEQ